jgi:hypothetical protein
MKILAIICRILLGLLFVVFGSNNFLHFMPVQMPSAGTPLAQWMSIMLSSGWLSFVAALEVIGGILLLIGGTVPLGLVILGPIIVNALLFHILLIAGTGVAAAAVAAVLEIVLIYAYRAHFAGIVTIHAKPTP